MRLWVDFNDVAGGRIEADLDYASFFRLDDLQPGGEASLFDDTGYECIAVINSYDAVTRTLDLTLRTETFSSTLARESQQRWGVPSWAAKGTGEGILGVT